MNEKDSQRVALVTGATDGIGRAVALELARKDNRVLITGRDPTRGAEVLSALHAARPGLAHAFVPADLSLLSETARLATEVEARVQRLDAVVCCAGILSTVPEWTNEGLERNFVLNYLTRYLLARKLLPLLNASPSGRLVLVSNAGNYADTLDFDDLQHRRGRPGLRVAGRTQFANDLLATELAARQRDSGLEVTCVFPGFVRTSVFRNARGLPRLLRWAAPFFQRFFAISPELAAQTPVFLAHSPRAKGSNGCFYGPRVELRVVPPRAQRSERRAALWSMSEALVSSYL
ncbi:MAG TPA: SDR family NAD(P)-dependent oxidoreductase [Polyangiaceae bacterium]|nr:SDR family NAD(P)-dependent oxidoreductase [Polyangiaceae bacterium]